MTTAPRAWLCELAQEDGSVNTMIVEQDPDGLRFGDVGEPSPFRVTALFGQVAIDSAVAAEKDRWLAKAGQTYRDAHAMFDDYSDPANKPVRDVIEWHLFNLRHDEIDGATP